MLRVFDAPQTAALLPFPALIDAIGDAAADVAAGLVLSPERQVLALGGGGVLLSMPATAPDIGVHKLVTVQAANAGLGLPTLHGTVTACDAVTGRPLCVLDGPEVTGRRTAAVSLLAIRTFLRAPPQSVLLIGTGVQAERHLLALNVVYPDCEVQVRGTSAESAARFCDAQGAIHPRLRPATAMTTDAQVVIALTTSREPVYDEAPLAGRLIIGVGAFKPEMAEIGKATLDGSDIYADDPAGARHEAGDLLRAGVDWARVTSLADALKRPPDLDRPIVFKSVGTAAWDLAAARVALRQMTPARCAR